MGRHLVDAGVLQPGQALIWDRPQLGKTYSASVTEQGAIHLENGGTFSAPSTAAIKAFGGGSFDGWYVWRSTLTPASLFTNFGCVACGSF
ncbi:MAG: hypothetical protein WKF33_04355 [Thermoleophilaceae bacterium]